MNRMTVGIGIVAVVLLGGCFSSRSVGVGQPVHVQVKAAQNVRDVGALVHEAGTRRGWTVTNLPDGGWLCAISQRGNICRVKVVQAAGGFDILPVESNIPVAKYNQWADNLRKALVNLSK